MISLIICASACARNLTCKFFRAPLQMLRGYLLSSLFVGDFFLFDLISICVDWRQEPAGTNIFPAVWREETTRLYEEPQARSCFMLVAAFLEKATTRRGLIKTFLDQSCHRSTQSKSFCCVQISGKRSTLMAGDAAEPLSVSQSK